MASNRGCGKIKTMKNHLILALITVLVLFSLVLSGCQAGVPQAQYDQLNAQVADLQSQLAKAQSDFTKSQADKPMLIPS